MIAFLKGIVFKKNSEDLILDVQGVGYEVYASSKTLEHLKPQEPAELFIYTCVREDSFKLYGFAGALEKKIFSALISVNGVGPKMALSLLSGISSLRSFVEMIETEDFKNLARLPRIGQKKAQQIVLALKGKLKEEGLEFKETSPSENQQRFLTSALLNLGFKMNEIKSVLEHLEKDCSREESLKQALHRLQPGR